MPESLAGCLSAVRSLIFWQVKRKLWDPVMDRTHYTGERTELILDRKKASDLMTARETDTEGRRSVFGQAFRQVAGLDPKRLRGKVKAFSALFRGESGEDAGGVYREALDHMCSELQSTALPLLVRCPNGTAAVGINREKWLLNPQGKGRTALAMFEFLGQLIAIALRTKNLLPLDFPPFVWKRLVNAPVNMTDLRGIDLCITQAIDTLWNLDSHGVTEEVFSDYFADTFVTRDSSGSQIELKENGADTAVTYDERITFATAIERCRLTEAEEQVAAVRRGLASIVPLDLLTLFTWQELELRVSGRPSVDLGLLKRCTTYGAGIRETDPHATYLWEVLEDFLPEQRCMFLRFVWGRSRLPVAASDFERNFELKTLQRDRPDDALPVSHTCFFSLELPKYSSKEILQQKLLYAVQHCQAIDADDAYAAGRRARDMGWTPT